MKTSLYRQKIDEVYAIYFRKRHEMEDLGIDPNEWELPLYEEFESVLIETHRKYWNEKNLASVHGLGRLEKRNVAKRVGLTKAHSIKARD